MDKRAVSRVRAKAGRLGGLGCSAAKLAAVRANGLKGGRPRRKPLPDAQKALTCGLLVMECDGCLKIEKGGES